MVRLIPASSIKYQGRRLEGACSKAALRKSASPPRPRLALRHQKCSDEGVDKLELIINVAFSIAVRRKPPVGGGAALTKINSADKIAAVIRVQKLSMPGTGGEPAGSPFYFREEQRCPKNFLPTNSR